MTSGGEHDAADPARWVGQTLDERYRIDAVLGAGGMGAVFRAEHLRLGKPVAVKIILPEHAGEADLASRFAREAMVTAKIEHPHVVSALDKGELPGGGAYLVMSLAPGTGLRGVMVRRHGWRFACEIGAQIADALVVAHALGVVHRDLKPENVIVEEREDGAVHARVLDFGIARALDTGDGPASGSASAAPLTRIGTILGTPGYMPPEQALGGTVDARADIYALGVLVWEIAAGRRLFTQTDLRDLAMAQLTEPIPEIGAGDAPAELQTLLDAMLMPKADERPASASEVQRTLRRLARAGEPGSDALVSGTAATAPAMPSPSAQTPAIPVTMARAPAPVVALPSLAAAGPGPRRRTGLVAAIAVAGLVALVVIGGFALHAYTSAPSLADVATTVPPTTVVPLPGTSDVPVATPPADDTGLADVPAALRDDAHTLVASPSVALRAEAARRLLPARAQLPAFVGHLADFELAQDCDARDAAVRALGADDDARAIAPLERIHDLPTTGCGASHTDDCHACMRRDVDRALAALRAEDASGTDNASATPPPPTTTATRARPPTKRTTTTHTRRRPHRRRR